MGCRCLSCAGSLSSVDVSQGVGGTKTRGAQAADGAGDQAADEGERNGEQDEGGADRSVEGDIRRRALGDGALAEGAGTGEPRAVLGRRSDRRLQRRRDRVDREHAEHAEHDAEAPPSRPWSSASPVTWRTTSRCDQPSALSVPSSRTRLFTEASVSRLAMRKAAEQADERKAVPSLLARFFASTSEPETRSARSCAVVTSAPSSPAEIFAATLSTSAADSARTSTALTRSLRAREGLQLRERDVDVRGLAAERRLRETDDRVLLAGERQGVSDLEAVRGWHRRR